jgi:hypothetical protein
MTDSIHPLPVGQRVYNSRGQQWACSLPGGTAVIREVIGPDHRGDYEYVVDGCREFSRQPGPDNPMDRRTQWQSYNTAPAYERSHIEDLLDRALLVRDRSGYGDTPDA